MEFQETGSARQKIRRSPSQTQTRRQSVMIRRSIVDLSDPKNNGDNAMATQQKKAQQIRRVASKRRASASNRPLKLSPSASSAELKMLSDEGSSVNESRISNYDTEIPGCRMALKEFRKRNCAIYEPILTLRTVSSLRPLFFVSTNIPFVCTSSWSLVVHAALFGLYRFSHG